MMELRLRVRCGKCGQRIGEVYDRGGASGLHYRPIFPGQTDRGDNINTARFWCADHGWTDPDEIARALASVADGEAPTLRARMGV